MIKNISNTPRPFKKIEWGNFLESDLFEATQFSREAFEPLRGASILIVGASGFVGSWLAAVLIYANRLYSLDYEVTLSFRSLEKMNHSLKLDLLPDVLSIQGDLHEVSEQIVFHDLSYTHVIHAATSTSAKFMAADTDSVLNGTAALLKAVTLRIKPVFMHLSSGAVYGADARENLFILETETKANLSAWEYAKCKAGLEKMVVRETLSGNLYGCNPRLFSFIGPLIPVDGTFAIGEFVMKALSKQEIIVKGSKNSTRSYMYPTDLTSWLLKILTLPTLKAINVGSEIAFDMSQLSEEVDKVFLGGGVIFSNLQLPSNHYVPKTTQTRLLYGVKENIGLQSSLQRWRDWLKLG